MPWMTQTPEILEIPEIWDLNSRSLIWGNKTMVLALMGGNMIIEIHDNLISMAKLNTRVCPHVQNFDFYGRIHPKVGTRNYTKVHEIFGPPPRGP